ncbi:hypothetical protein ACLOJK_006769 [Asimina triloba]
MARPFYSRSARQVQIQRPPITSQRHPTTPTIPRSITARIGGPRPKQHPSKAVPPSISDPEESSSTPAHLPPNFSATTTSEHGIAFA